MIPAAFLLPLSLHLPAPRAQDDVFLERLNQVAALIVEEPVLAPGLFNDSFTRAMPAEKIRELMLTQFFRHGPVESVSYVRRDSEYAGSAEFVFGKGETMLVKLGLNSRAPYSIVTLWFGPVDKGVKDLEAVAQSIGSLRGKTSFALARLGAEGPELIAAHEPDLQLAIGSTAKLYLLGLLAKDLAGGQRKLEDLVRLEARLRSLPSGRLQTWPEGSPLTLHSLAAAMISESDNTATDHLLFLLGRTRVEGMLAEMGHSDPARNMPFLSTGEFFRLRLAEGGALAEAWRELTVEERREYADVSLGALPLDPGQLLDMPLDASIIEQIEWFGSALDLCRAVDWLRRATEDGKAAPLRSVLGINPGLPLMASEFDFLGYKGGSEPGVLEMAFLVRTRQGNWYALAAGWNDTRRQVDPAQLQALVQRALVLLGRQG